MDRRDFFASCALRLTVPALAQRTQQRVVVLMFDGFGLEYLDQSHMPVLARWRKRGLFRRVKTRCRQSPKLTMRQFCCGVLPERAGREDNGHRRYAPGARAVSARQKQGVKSALLSCQKKTRFTGFP